MGLNEFHAVLFNAGIMFSSALGIWATIIAAKEQPMSGNYWGAVFTYSGLMAVVTLLGVIMAAQGLAPGPEENKRALIYFLYMAYFVVIKPGVFAYLRGRDDKQAALTFAFLGFFDAAAAMSMIMRSAHDWS